MPDGIATNNANWPDIIPEDEGKFMRWKADARSYNIPCNHTYRAIIHAV
jgi:hypothetical protein